MFSGQSEYYTLVKEHATVYFLTWGPSIRSPLAYFDFDDPLTYCKNAGWELKQLRPRRQQKRHLKN